MQNYYSSCLNKIPKYAQNSKYDDAEESKIMSILCNIDNLIKYIKEGHKVHHPMI